MTGLLAWQNLAKGATIHANSEATGLPASNMASDIGSPSTAWQTLSGALTVGSGALFTIKPAASGSTWRVMGLFRTNLTAGATVNFALWNNGGGTPVLVWNTNIAGPTSGYGQVICVLPEDTVADFAQIFINDASNPDNFINVPLVFAGPAWFPLGSISFSSTVGRDKSSADVTTRGGQEYPSLLWQRRRWNIELDSIRIAETWSDVDALAMYAAGGSNVLFLPESTSSDLPTEAIFGRLTPTADISFPYQGADRRRWQAQITERL